MRFSVFTLTLIVCCCWSVFAQDFREGYVILNNGDSLAGKVAYRHSKKNSLSCKFRPGSSRESVTYLPSQIQAYGYFFDKRFESKVLPDPSSGDSLVFTEVVVKGYASLLSRSETLYVEMSDGKITRLPPADEKLIEKEDGPYMARDVRYVGLLNILLADCNLKADEIPYDQTRISHLIQNYNVCHYRPGVYYKETKKTSLLTFQAFAGLQSGTLFIPSEAQALATSLLPTAGISVDISAPKIFDRIFFSTELIYSMLSFRYYWKVVSSDATNHYDYTVKQNFLKIPAGFRYNLRDEYSTPYVKAGVAFGVPLNFTIEGTQEVEKPNEVRTYIASEKRKAPQVGYYGSLGYTQGIRNKYRAFIEARYEWMQSYGRESLYIPEYTTTSFYFVTGVRF